VIDVASGANDHGSAFRIFFLKLRMLRPPCHQASLLLAWKLRARIKFFNDSPDQKIILIFRNGPEVEPDTAIADAPHDRRIKTSQPCCQCGFADARVLERDGEAW
jgi:hypothetical protein